MQIGIRDVQKSEEVKNLLDTSTKQMKALGYTEHSYRHCRLVSNACGDILEKLGDEPRTVELARIAGYLHDIGNAVNRIHHSQYGAILAYNLLARMGMPGEEACAVMMAIANHDETDGVAIDRISAALILADKADVHRSRVTNRNRETFDIHDRVNYASKRSVLTVDPAEATATLDIDIDTAISPVMDYFEIFLVRMKMCRNAAGYLGLAFRLVINGTRLL
ncbi:MAG: HD domain-containing protein [Clostridia bacterium]|nr:HD domain-containing protein [Clostridia bacterium]